MKVKVLSVRNPLSYLICSGIKDVENRSWPTNYRGRVYIHSSGKDGIHPAAEAARETLPCMHALEKAKKGEDGRLIFPDWSPLAENEFGYIDLINKKYLLEYEFMQWLQEAKDERREVMRAQAIVGYVDIVDCTGIKPESPWSQDYSPYYWILRNAVLFDKPILGIPGKLRFFEVEI